MNYSLSFALHSSIYEENHFDSDGGTNIAESWGNLALAQMGFGFRSRLEGAHDFMH